MSRTDPVSLLHSVEKTNQWLDELADELGRPKDRRYALSILRGVLHAVRDRLPVDDAAHLGAQLPELLRCVYYEAWRPSTTPHPYRDAAEATARVMRRHVTAGELSKVRAVLPRPVADLLPLTEETPQ